MGQDLSIRTARMDDAAAIAAIYAPFVRDTAISFEENAPSATEIATRIRATLVGHPYLVAEVPGTVVAYAYAGPYRARSAYRHTAEVSAYASPSARCRGIGQALYRALLADLTSRGFHRAVAIITLPNDASVVFHERMGFTHAGTLREVGRKFDRWHDTGLWQRHLSAD